MEAVIHKIVLKNMTPSDAKKRLSATLFATISFTFVFILGTALSVFSYILTKNPAGVLFLLNAFLYIAFTSILWWFYSSVRKRAAEGE